MKHASAIVIFLALSFRLFAGGHSDINADDTTARMPTAPGELPIVDTPITLSAFAPSIGIIADFSTNALYKWVEETTGVHIQWIESSKVDAKNKLSAMLASGEYPDIIFGASGSGLAVQDIYRYGKQGIFISMNELIKKYAFHIDEFFEAEPDFKAVITSPDGNIYGLPAVITDDYHMTMRQKFWINKSWLEKLGLAMPTNTDEFYKTMKAFKERDPNGNGLADEIPMTGAKRHLEDLALWIMNAFVPAGGQDDSGDAFLNCYEFIVDGKVFFSADKEAFKSGLIYLHKLYEEGLFNVSSLTQDRAQIKPLIEDGINRVGGVASHHPGNFASLTDDLSKPFHDYAALPPLQGPDGARNTPWFIDAVIRPGEFVITNRCEYPEVAFRWADQFYSLETMLNDKGVEGVHWAKLSSEEKLADFNGNPAKYKYLNPLTPEDNAQINMGPGWTRDLKYEFAVSSDFSYEQLLFDATKLYDPYKVKRYPYGTVIIADAVFSEFNDLRRVIHTYVAEATDRFIIGDMDIDEYWPAYIKQLDRIGLARFLWILEDSLLSNAS